MLAGSIFTSSLSGILQPAANRDRAPLDRVALGKLFAANFARRINARPRLVDDDVVNVLVLKLGGQNLGDQLLGLPAGGAVADRDHA